MPESIIIHFREADTADVIRRIERQFVPCPDHCWRFPLEDQLLRVGWYSDFLSEYESPEKDRVMAMLGGEPTVSLDFEIRRSRSDEACDVLERFVRRDLSNLNFVVDDNHDSLIPPSRLDRLEDFLDVYRYRRRTEQGSQENPTAHRDPL